MSRATVLVTGCFDLLTEAHLRLLAWAGQLGDVVVGIDHEDTIPLLDKGPGRPILSDDERRDALMALPQVTRVVSFKGPGAAAVIETQRPTIWLKGGDYTLDTLRDDEKEAAKAVRCAVCFAPEFPGLSTSDIIERIRGPGRATLDDADADT